MRRTVVVAFAAAWLAITGCKPAEPRPTPRFLKAM